MDGGESPATDKFGIYSSLRTPALASARVHGRKMAHTRPTLARGMSAAVVISAAVVVMMMSQPTSSRRMCLSSIIVLAVIVTLTVRLPSLLSPPLRRHPRLRQRCPIPMRLHTWMSTPHACITNELMHTHHCYCCPPITSTIITSTTTVP